MITNTASACTLSPPTAAFSLNLSDLLVQSETKEVTGSGPALGGLPTDLVKGALTQGSGGDIGQLNPTCQSSLAKLMAEHEHKCAGALPTTGPGQNISVPTSVSTDSSKTSLFSSLGQSTFPMTGLTLGPAVSLSSGFPMGLGTSPGNLSISPASTFLSCSLGTLSLQDPKVPTPFNVPLGSLSNVLQSSKPVEMSKASKGSGNRGQEGSPSLAELIQEHQSSRPGLFSSVPSPENACCTLTVHPQTVMFASTVQTPPNSFSLSGLDAHSPAKPPAAVPPGFSAVPSLSDLLSQTQSPKISENPALSIPQKGRIESKKSKTSPQGHKPLSTAIDLSMLMSQTSPVPLHLSEKCSPVSLHPIHNLSSRNTCSIFAKPSVFALTLCVRMQKKRSQHAGPVHKAFLYSRQMARVKERVQGPLYHITPFTFDTPSPDDIVKENQKKAFTRE